MTTKSNTESGIEIFFDRYCPESRMEGERVEMRLNDDDFWESISTGLQMTVFPPYAAILPWRGKGQFRSSGEVASDSCTGLVMTYASTEKGHETFPDETNPLRNWDDFRDCLNSVFPSEEAYEAGIHTDFSAPNFVLQKSWLTALNRSEIEGLVALFSAWETTETQKFPESSSTFSALHEALYDQKIIFNYDWPGWIKGKGDLNRRNFDFSKSTLTELSMYLTMIFRADRFSDGTIQRFYDNGVLPRIFSALLPAWQRETIE